MKRRIAILGSTGSIGTQALEVVDSLPDLLQVEALAAYSNADLLIQQAKKYKPNIVVIVREELCDKVKSALWDDDIKVFAGEQSLVDVAAMDCVDMVLSAIVGVAGLRPAYHAIECGKPLALANKETLVVAGSLMTSTAAAKGVNIYPVDSEHSAIFQCLAGEFHNPIEKLIITASGGPFRGKDAAFLKTVTREDALHHPNWNMGPKITIDSATMMNKGLEIIEASWLFNVPIDKIDVVVHPQSIIHSLVQFADGAVKAQLGLPDMKLPIQYALTYPARQPNHFSRFSFADYPQLTFEQPDRETFPCISLACEAFRQGGNMPCVLNAANEVAVRSFLQGEIGFTDIPKHIEKCLSAIPFSKPASVDEFLQVDAEVRKIKCVNS